MGIFISRFIRNKSSYFPVSTHLLYPSIPQHERSLCFANDDQSVKGQTVCSSGFAVLGARVSRFRGASTACGMLPRVTGNAPYLASDISILSEASVDDTVTYRSPLLGLLHDSGPKAVIDNI